MSPICASWPVNRSTGCSVTLIRCVFALLPLELAAQRQHPDLHPALPPPVRVTATSSSSSTGPVRN